ncbi:hypothetical protein ACWDPV_00810 [Gordonia sp. NPDC003504]
MIGEHETIYGGMPPHGLADAVGAQPLGPARGPRRSGRSTTGVTRSADAR